MAQLAGICMLDPEAEKKDQLFFGGVDNCRWRKPVVPGDMLVRCRDMRPIDSPDAIAHICLLFRLLCHCDDSGAFLPAKDVLHLWQSRTSMSMQRSLACVRR